ncbi:hypothetical protein RQP46_002905 [Phenoliferia psychrophenolica]
MSTNATIASLPAELIAEVFTHFQHGLYFTDLCKFALVCRSWRDLAQQALYSVLYLSLVEPRTRAWLESPARTRYHCKTLNLTQYDSIMASEVREALRGVRSLDFMWQDDDGYEWLCGLQTTSLTSLRIASPEKFPTTASPPLQLSLRHLDLCIIDDYFGTKTRLRPNQISTIFSSSRETLLTLRLNSLGTKINAKNLIDYFTKETFENLHTLIFLENGSTIKLWPKFFALFPSLATFEISDFDEKSIAAVAASATAGLSSLTFGHEIESYMKNWNFTPFDAPLLVELLHILRLPNLAGLRRLTFRTSRQAEFETEEGLAVLDECKKRSITLLCRSGYLTRDMVRGSA